MTPRTVIRIAFGTTVLAILAGGFTAWRLQPASPPSTLTLNSPSTPQPAIDSILGAGAPAKAGNLDMLAERLATRLASTDPGDGNGWALLARAYVALGRKEEAVAAFDRAQVLLGDSDMQLQADRTSARAALMASRHPSPQ